MKSAWDKRDSSGGSNERLRCFVFEIWYAGNLCWGSLNLQLHEQISPRGFLVRLTSQTSTPLVHMNSVECTKHQKECEHDQHYLLRVTQEPSAQNRWEHKLDSTNIWEAPVWAFLWDHSLWVILQERHKADTSTIALINGTQCQTSVKSREFENQQRS